MVKWESISIPSNLLQRVLIDYFYLLTTSSALPFHPTISSATVDDRNHNADCYIRTSPTADYGGDQGYRSVAHSLKLSNVDLGKYLDG